MKLVLAIALCCLISLGITSGPSYKQVVNYQLEQSESVIQASEGYYIWQTEDAVYTVQNGEQTQISPSALCPISTYFTYALQNDQYFCFVNGTEPNSIVVNLIDILTGNLISQTNYSDVFFPPFNAEMNGDFYEFINSSLPLGNFEAQIYNLALNKFVCSPVISYPSNLETLGSLPENEYYIFIANDPTTKIVTYWYFDCITAEVTEIPTNLEVSFITMDSFLNGQVVVSIVFTEVQGEQQVFVQTWDRSVLKNTYQFPLGPGNSILGTSCDFQVIDETSFFLTFGRGDTLNLTVFDVNLDFTIQTSTTALFPSNCGQFFPGFEPNTFWTTAKATTIFFDYTNLEVNSLVNFYAPTLEFENGEVITLVIPTGYFVTYGPGNSQFFSSNFNAGNYYDHAGVVYLLNVECGNCELTVFNSSDSSINSYNYKQCPYADSFVYILDAQLLSNGEYGVTYMNMNTEAESFNALVGNDIYTVNFGNVTNYLLAVFPNYDNLEATIVSEGGSFALTTLSMQTEEVLNTYIISEVGITWSVVKLNSTLFVYGGNSLSSGMGNVFSLDSMSTVQSTKLPFLFNDDGGNPFVPLGVNLEADPIVSGFVFTQLIKNLTFPVVLANYLGEYVVVSNLESGELFSSGNNQFYAGTGKTILYPGVLYEVSSFASEEKRKKKLNLRQGMTAVLHDFDNYIRKS